MNNNKRHYILISILLIYALIYMSCRLFFMRTEVKWVLDDGNKRRTIIKSDISTLPDDFYAALRSSNATGWLYGYTTIGTKKIYQGYYQNGRVDGVESNWYRNGVLHSVDCFSNGVHVGDSFMFYSNGQTQQWVRYVSGEVSVYKSWDEDGSLKAEGRMGDGL